MIGENFDGASPSTRLPRCRAQVFRCLVVWSIVSARLSACKTSPSTSARLPRNGQIGRFIRAWLALCSLMRARWAVSAGGRWRELARVTSPFRAIHRVSSRSPRSLPCLAVSATGRCFSFSPSSLVVFFIDWWRAHASPLFVPLAGVASRIR